MDIKINDNWMYVLSKEFDKEYFKDLWTFIKSEYHSKTIYPSKELIFNAFNLCPFDNVKVVIIGQDPYHAPNQAQGLCFSVPNNIKTPPSLRNIFKEIDNDLGGNYSNQNDLTYWAQQGVFMTNAILTVEAEKAGSHQKKGWEIFTDSVIELLNNKHENLVFMLWGTYAQHKGKLIDKNRHLVLQSVHPSPLSASRGFYGNQHFSRTNEYLLDHAKTPISWQKKQTHHSGLIVKEDFRS